MLLHVSSSCYQGIQGWAVALWSRNVDSCWWGRTQGKARGWQQDGNQFCIWCLCLKVRVSSWRGTPGSLEDGRQENTVCSSHPFGIHREPIWAVGQSRWEGEEGCWCAGGGRLGHGHAETAECGWRSSGEEIAAENVQRQQCQASLFPCPCKPSNSKELLLSSVRKAGVGFILRILKNMALCFFTLNNIIWCTHVLTEWKIKKGDFTHWLPLLVPTTAWPCLRGHSACSFCIRRGRQEAGGTWNWANSGRV